MLLVTSASLLVTSALLVVTRTLLGAPGIATRSKNATLHVCDCDGVQSVPKECTRNDCPVDCVWGDWSRLGFEFAFFNL